MSVEDYELSIDRGNPAELFEFVYGDAEDQVYRYTNADREVVLAGNTYLPLTISHESIKSKGRGEAVETKITVPATSDIAVLFSGVIPRRVITAKIFKGHITKSDDPLYWRGTAGGVFQAHWFGRVTERTRKKASSILTCTTLGAGMRRPALGMYYQRGCQHVLYGNRCGANKEDFTTTVTLDTTTSTGVLLDAGWEGALSPAAYIGGLLEWESDYGPDRVTILGASSAGVRTDAPVRDIAPGTEMTVAPGCGHTMDHCRDRFNNILNFGGHPYIPLTNPVNKNNHT
ncbi:hypothetical protein LOKG_00035 [Loktanella phage pCB2051-A]|uniref:Bacteriophage phiJL001 Gp84 C-terminal domain-containing protein n=1 Tax=Loktanella phage pCB2051-A TaxID=754044 RepID=M4QNZ5_9CAUD|nr:tail assembly protein [Loktanella phage pCB2051-A]AGH31471.1 hypothetical protein LOKG_00035 [Loktanella phage pCB2051-A]